MNFPDLTKRLVTSLISLFILACIFVFSSIGIVKWLIAFFTAGIGALAIWEFCRLSKLNTKLWLSELLIAVGFLTVFSFYLSTFRGVASLFPFLLIFCGILSIFLYHFDKISGSIESIAKSVFVVCYVAVPVGLLLKILYLSPFYGGGQEGRLWLLYLLVVTKMTDVGAYFAGRLIGRGKLAPHISPGKTVNGALAGFVSAVFFSFLFHLLGEKIHGFHLTLTHSLWLGALLGFLGQLGDLGESLFKRDAAVKDSNRLPGLGGILDMLDSLLFTTPVVYFFLHWY